MASSSAFRIQIDVAPLSELAARLDGITPDQIGAFIVPALNQTVDSAYEMSRKAILSGVNLTDEYVQRKMQVEHATNQRPVAAIIAPTGAGFTTSLSHYGALQMTKPVKWPNRKRKGNAALGIPVGEKASGKSVEVIRGVRKPIGPAFSIAGKKDSDGNLVMFHRKRGSKKQIEALSGPSVYQLFRVAAGIIEDRVGADLEQAIIKAAERGMLGILS